MGGPRIKQEQKDAIIELRRSGMSYADIGRALGISPTAARIYSGDIEEKESREVALAEGEVAEDIPGYGGRYLVTNYGKVFTRQYGTLRELHVDQTKSGLRKVKLSMGWHTRTEQRFIDELVAEVFVKRVDESHIYVVHLDGDASNDSADNLRWSDVKQTKKSRKLTLVRKPKRSLTEDEAEEVRKRWLAGEDVSDIVKDYDTSTSTIRHAFDGMKREFKLPECEPGEEWAEIEGFNGWYYVSSRGRIFSTGGGRYAPLILKQSPDAKGYMQVHLTYGHGRGKSFPVHRLVAMAFCEGHTDERNVVNHIDGNRLNNDARNLEWVTSAENTAHAVNVLGIYMGGPKPFETHVTRTVPRDPTSRPSPLRRFTDDQVRSIRSDQRSTRALAKEYGVHPCTISAIKSGKRYKNI